LSARTPSKFLQWTVGFCIYWLQVEDELLVEDPSIPQIFDIIDHFLQRFVKKDHLSNNLSKKPPLGGGRLCQVTRGTCRHSMWQQAPAAWAYAATQRWSFLTNYLRGGLF
jgi:hypothetical protein